MLVSSLRRLASKAFSRAADWLDPVEEQEKIEVVPRLALYQPPVRRSGRPVRVFKPDPALVADMDAIEAEFEDFFRNLDDETTPEYLN